MNENVKPTDIRQIKVKQVAKTTTRGKKANGYGEQEVVLSRNKTEKSEVTCYRCESRSHLGNSKDFVAVNQSCSKSRKRGHCTGMQSNISKKNTVQTVRMIEKSYVESDEEENVILMLSSESQEDNGIVEIPSMMVTQKRRPPSCVVSVNNSNVKSAVQENYKTKEKQHKGLIVQEGDWVRIKKPGFAKGVV
ncbi:hypothetical protein NDU88_007485 [Pleurodeles waltl]|uniref:Uncharacterized protein n=1 Tax=Pleurodeles waltl TaxID=8319 RepID=A0AAV7SSG0_PLEWA|nr:hypothetical protein NDU88_007485 [Pleurodeles waltl]